VAQNIPFGITVGWRFINAATAPYGGSGAREP